MNELQLIKRITVIKMIMLAFLQVLDVASTLIFLKLGLPEANPLVTSASNPTQRMFELKLIFMAYTTWVCLKHYQKTNFQNVILFGILLYMLVVSWNLIAIMLVMGIL